MTSPRPHPLAVFAALASTFDLAHETLDHWCQPTWAARHKRRYGNHLVYRDGIPVNEAPRPRPGCPTMTATQLGRRACTQHVAIYTAGQVAVTIAVTRLLGYRISPLALATGTAVNAATHWALDRGAFLRRLAAVAGKTQYLTAMTVVRAHDHPPATTGAGTAWNELDRSAHRFCGLIATVVTTILTTRKAG